MKTTFKSQLVTFLTGFIFFFVFIRANQAQGQISINIKPDTLCILNGHVNILMKAGTYDTIATEYLIQMYSSTFNEGQVVSTKGFRFNQNSNLRFYQTSIENYMSNDGGLSTWKLIETFTDKIPQGRWIESKWEAHAGGSWYYVQMASRENLKKFYKFIFFYIDNKLAFCVHEYTVDPLHTVADNSEPGNYLTYVYAYTHPSKYTGFERK